MYNPSRGMECDNMMALGVEIGEKFGKLGFGVFSVFLS
jgi:hypothetical protein